MSYRTIKKLLGETALERKCLFLFGGGLMLLITGSFYLYAWMNEDLIYDHNNSQARAVTRRALYYKHWQWSESDEDFKPMIKALFEEVDTEDFKDVEYQLFKANPTEAETDDRPDDNFGHEALEQLKRGETEVTSRDDESGRYLYYGAIHAKKSCVTCHYHRLADPNLSEGDLIGMARISLPLSATQRALNENNAFLLTMAIVTSVLAMLALYLIVRYVIVKPVLHLKDVSDAIARGNLNLRADIRTGDEFEELSHAFNRMLRHLVTVQDELREVNTDLDEKVDDLAQVNLRLYEMNKLKDEFLATMSHELRTPLNSILGFSDVLADAKNLNGKQHRYVENIQISGKSLMSMINDVLDLTKIESGKMALQIVEFSLEELIERQVSSMMPLAAQKNIDLTSQLESSVGTLVQDSGKLQQILNNLLSNAVKFTPEGGRVRVRAEMYDERTLDLIVEDSGIGIPLVEQATIFEKFRQGQTIPGQRDPMKREYGGTGLGLSIVKELTKLLGGEVILDSEFGKGSAFTVRLPIRLDQQPRRIDDELRARTIELDNAPPAQLETAVTAASDAVDESPSDSDGTAA